MICLVLTVVAAPAFAFQGPEHKEMSNRALKAAIALPGTRCHTEATAMLPPEKNTFGDITWGVDWFHKPEKLANAEDPWKAMPHERRNPYKHFVALHRNKHHFQLDALHAHGKFHQTAVKLAGRGQCKEALQSEAVALHFLQDAFAAGHIVTPRAGFHDVVSGALHDRFNRDGLPGVISAVEAGRGTWQALGAMVRADGAPFGAIDLDMKAEAGLVPFRAYGDGRLNGDGGPVQAYALVLASARSIAEVVQPAAEERMTVCFEPRSANVDDKGMLVDNTYEGPAIGVGTTTSPQPEIPDVCVPETNFLTVDVGSHEKLQLGFRDAPGVQFTFGVGKSTKSSEWREVVNASWIFGGDDPSNTVRVRGSSPPRYHTGRGLQTMALSASFAQGAHSRSIGVQFEYGLQLVEKWRMLGGSFRVGPRRYSAPTGAFWRYFEYGGKVTLGVEVFNAVLLIDRTRTVRENGSISAETFIAPGFEFALSGSWITEKAASVFRRK